MEFIVTTTRDNQEELLGTAQRWARALQVPAIPRDNWNLEKMKREYEVDAILLASAQGPKVYCRKHKFFYHPSMAQLRIENIKKGQIDHMAEAMNLHSSMRVLDCTLGLAADAAIASYIVGETGKVVGLEGSDILHFVVQQGLKNYEAKDSDLTAALRRIIAVHTDAATYLATRMEEFDVIYFDPMFETPVEGSSNMEPLRDLAYQSKLTPKIIQLALQRAPRVVIKERYIKYLRDLGCTEVMGGKYSSVKYGVIQK